MRLCSIIDCGSKHFANGLCIKHNAQKYHFGEIRERTRNDPNKITVDNNDIKIELYNIKNVVIAEAIADFKYKSEIEKFKWYLSSKDYVKTSWYDETGQQHGFLHHLIIQLSGQEVNDDQEVDHKDTNKLNNKENNLRICDSLQNHCNRKKQRNNTSGYIGVIWHKKSEKWRVYITVEYRKFWVGSFFDKNEAAQAYNDAALKYHGEFAKLNIIKET